MGACWCRRRHYVLGLSVRSSIVRLSVRLSVRIGHYETCEHDILTMNRFRCKEAKGIYGSRTRHDNFQGDEVKVTRGVKIYWRPGEGITFDPLTSNLKLSGFFWIFRLAHRSQPASDLDHAMSQGSKKKRVTTCNDVPFRGLNDVPLNWGQVPKTEFRGVKRTFKPERRERQ